MNIMKQVKNNDTRAIYTSTVPLEEFEISIGTNENGVPTCSQKLDTPVTSTADLAEAIYDVAADLDYDDCITGYIAAVEIFNRSGYSINLIR